MREQREDEGCFPSDISRRSVTGAQELGAGFQVLGLGGKGLERQAHTNLQT